jgi:trehalose 6-phosphate synthase/phosphatase
MDSFTTDRYVRSHNRLFLLDYDGTLVNFKTNADHAIPTEQLRSSLEQLAGDKENQVVIVSGRDRKSLDRMLGDLPISFVAEHGFFFKDLGGEWFSPIEKSTAWKHLVHRFMRSAAAGRPGVHIEEKVSSLVWHYDGAGSGAAEAATELRRKLLPEIKNLGLKAVPGRKILEVRVADVNKGLAAKRWLDKDEWDFIFAAGDDTTDEDMFAAMPEAAISIKIGAGETVAKKRLETPTELNDLLTLLSKRA